MISHQVNLLDLANAISRILTFGGPVCQISKMYKSVPYALQCKYIVWQLFKTLAQQSYSLQEFLSKFSYLRELKEFQPFLQTVCPDVNQCKSSDEVTEHFQVIWQHLSKYSHKWLDIGRFLLPANTLEQIKCKCNYEPSGGLYEVLQRWCDMSPKPTIGQLVEVLRSEAVGIGRVAANLITIISDNRKDRSWCETSAHQSESSDLKDLVLSGVSEEIDLQADEVSVLFEVNLNDPYTSHPRLQWYKDGVRIDNENDCILCTTIRDISDESTYTCKIEGLSESSNPVVVTVKTPIDEHKKVLSENYNSEPEVLVDTWPEVQQNTYINLAILSDRDFNINSDLSRQSIQGSADDVWQDKSSTDYRSTFSTLEQANRVLIVGRPGSGKTTLVHKVSKDWASGKIQWKAVRLLFLVHLRGYRSDPSVDLKAIIGKYFKDQLVVNVISDFAMKHHGLGLCFILDGLDEYQPSNIDDTFISKLIKKDVLSKAIVIVSSRPAAVASFRKKATKEIEVLGFFKKEILNYIHSYKFSSESSKHSLINYLNQHPNVYNMCYLPIQSAMICFLYEVEGGLPQTESQIYKEFTKHSILRSFYKAASEKRYLESVDLLKDPERKCFHNVCQLAFEKTRSSLQILEQHELESLCDNVMLEDTLGLITVDYKATKCGFQNIYTFCHLTFQEFLAAYHVFLQEKYLQMEIIRECGPMDHMQVVFKFFCGLVQFDSNCKLFEELFSVSNFKPLFRIQCAFETQQSHVCDFVASKFFYFNDDFMTSSDFTAVGYVVAHASKKKIVSLSFNCSPDIEYTHALTKALEGHVVSLSSLEFRGSAIGNLKAIFELTKIFPSLEVLSIADTELEAKDIDSISCISPFKLDKLKVLKFCCESSQTGYRPLPADQLVKMVDKLSSLGIRSYNICFSASNREFMFSKLQTKFPYLFYSLSFESNVSFNNCNFSSSEVLSMALDFYSGSICTELSLVNCNIDDDKATLLAESLSTNTVLKKLTLTANKISDKGAIAIADILPQVKIQWIDLNLNKINDEGGLALISAADKKGVGLSLFGNNISCKRESNEETDSMKLLSISGKVGDSGIVNVESYFTEEMSHEALELNSCDNYFEGLESVISMMKKCLKLLSVTLVDCNINDSGAKLLASFFCSLNHGLRTINLSCNRITSVGLKELLMSINLFSQLQVFNLNENRIGREGALLISEYLHACENIKDLQLSGNYISDEGVKYLATVIQNNSSLHSLKLRGNVISDTGAELLAASLKSCKHLREIDLSFNMIGSNGISCVATSLENCTDLQTFNIGHNNFKGDGMLKIANCLGKSHKLVDIDLSSNNTDTEGVLEELADSFKHCALIESVNLSYCNIGDSSVVAFSHRMSSCKTLKHLNFSYNKITGSGLVVLCYLIRQCTNLTSLDLSHNKMAISNVEAESLAEALRACTNLKSLDLSHNEMGNKGLTLLAGFLKNCKSLKELSFKHCGISNFQILSDCFKECEHIQTIDFSENDMSKQQNPFVFIENCHNLQTLILHHNKIQGKSFTNLATSMRKSRNIKTLDISGNDLDMEGIHFIQSLETFPNLCCLQLGNKTHYDLVVCLVLSLTNCGNLHTIDISNTITKDGSYLKDILIGCDNLRAFISSHNYISDNVAVHLAKFCGNIQILDLSNNEIADDGAKALAACFMESRKLEQLKLGGNNIGNVGVTELAASLKVCSGLCLLDLSQNQITNEGNKSLSLALKCCSQLNCLDLSSTSFSLSGAEMLADTLKSLTQMKKLLLWSISVSTDGAIVLAFALKNLHYLQELSFDVSSMSDIIAMAVAYSLRNSCFLREVSFVHLKSENKQLSDLTASEIRAILQRNSFSHSHRLIPDNIKEFLSELEIAESQYSLKEFLLSMQSIEKYISIIPFLTCETNFMEPTVSHEGCRAIALSLQTCGNLRVVRFDSKYQHLGRYLPKILDGQRVVCLPK